MATAHEADSDQVGRVISVMDRAADAAPAPADGDTPGYTAEGAESAEAREARLETVLNELSQIADTAQRDRSNPEARVQAWWAAVHALSPLSAEDLAELTGLSVNELTQGTGATDAIFESVSARLGWDATGTLYLGRVDQGTDSAAAPAPAPEVPGEGPDALDKNPRDGADETGGKYYHVDLGDYRGNREAAEGAIRILLGQDGAVVGKHLELTEDLVMIGEEWHTILRAHEVDDNPAEPASAAAEPETSAIAPIDPIHARVLGILAGTSGDGLARMHDAIQRRGLQEGQHDIHDIVAAMQSVQDEDDAWAKAEQLDKVAEEEAAQQQAALAELNAVDADAQSTETRLRVLGQQIAQLTEALEDTRRRAAELEKNGPALRNAATGRALEHQRKAHEARTEAAALRQQHPRTTASDAA